MDKIIIIDNNEIRDELEQFITENKRHILFNSDMDLLSLESNPVLKEIIDTLIGINEKRVIKILAPFLAEQPDVEILIKRSFLDEETRMLYHNHYKNRLEILNMV